MRFRMWRGLRRETQCSIMTVHTASHDPNHDEPTLGASRGVLWVAAAIAALVLGGTAAAVLVLSDSDNLANHWIAGGASATRIGAS